MGYIEVTDRRQLSYWSLEDMVSDESMVRVINRFIDIQELEHLGFTRTQPAVTGRPGYPAHVLAKLYVYGYENGIRSSRKLEKETRRNVEMMWLVEGLTPDYKTIAEFRRQNIRPLQKLFREFVKLCRSWELVGGKLIANDGSKFKASNNKKNNFSRKKLDDRLRRIDEKIESYMAKLDEEDFQDNAVGTFAQAGLAELLQRKERYEEYMAHLDLSGDNEISTVDPDARLMGNNRDGVDTAYNVQSAVDGKHHIILDYDVSLNPADHGQMGVMAKKLVRKGFRRFTMLSDKGFYNGKDLQRMKRLRLTAVVARQKPSNPKNQPKQFHMEQFQYDKETDTYRCPMGKILTTKTKQEADRRIYTNKVACRNCPHTSDCISGKTKFRTVTRNNYSDIYEEANKIFDENTELYRLRQQIVEHPFGTVKHTMNGRHFLLRTRRKVRCEVALLFLGYNLKRVINVLGFKGIMTRMEAALSKFLVYKQTICLDFTAFLLPE